MIEVQFIECIQERDIDLLLMEEFECNEEFRAWFLERIEPNSSAGSKLAGVWHSIKEAELGESDIIVCFDTETNSRMAVLIENKIDAELQPDQPERYLERGRIGKERGYWDEFRTCIIAPIRYVKTTDTSAFQRQITYEELLHWFSENSNEGCRIAFKSKLVKEAIEKNRRGYQVVEHSEVTAFWFQYWGLVNTEFSDLQMPKPVKKGWKADWPEFYPANISSGTRLIHKMRDGFVDLQFAGRGNDFDNFIETVGPLLEEDMVCKKRGESAAVSIEVPSVDRFKPFSEQRASVYRAIDAARRLAKWYIENKIRIP